MTEPRWESILLHLAEFHRHLAPHVPQLKIEHLNDRRWSDEQYRHQLKTGRYDLSGVYLMFDRQEQLEYVGLAIQAKGFHGRIWSHDDYCERLYTDIIPFPRPFVFLAPALEYFLICRLNPPKNSTYRGHDLPEFECDSNSR